MILGNTPYVKIGVTHVPVLVNMTPARSRAMREIWEDPLVRQLRSNAMRDAWHRRRQSNPITIAALRMWNTFACACGAECVGTITGPLLCSNCRAERCA